MSEDDFIDNTPLEVLEELERDLGAPLNEVNWNSAGGLRWLYRLKHPTTPMDEIRRMTLRQVGEGINTAGADASPSSAPEAGGSHDSPASTDSTHGTSGA